MLRVGLRHLTGHLTGKVHKIPRVYRGPYGFTGKMTPGDVSLSLGPEFSSDSSGDFSARPLQEAFPSKTLPISVDERR